MTTPAIRLRSNPNADDLIARREEFITPTLAASYVRWPPELGLLDPELAQELGTAIRHNRNHDDATYVVRSYSTPIAWCAGKADLYVPTIRYSGTTTRHQRLCEKGRYAR